MTPSKYYSVLQVIIDESCVKDFNFVEAGDQFVENERDQIKNIYNTVIGTFNLHNVSYIYIVLNFIFSNVWDLIYSCRSEYKCVENGKIVIEDGATVIDIEDIVDMYIQVLKLAVYYMSKINKMKGNFVNQETFVYSFLYSVILSCKVLDDYSGNNHLSMFDYFLCISGFYLRIKDHHHIDDNEKRPVQYFSAPNESTKIKMGDYVIKRMIDMEAHITITLLNFDLKVCKVEYDELFSKYA